VGAMSKLLGVAPICDKLEAQTSKASAEARVNSEGVALVKLCAAKGEALCQ